MRVLVVEDEPDLRRLIAQALRENGYAVDDAPDGQEGLYKATTWEYDAIVLDLMLPKISGLDLLQTFRKTHKTPVLILSARDTMPDRVLGLDQGADDYLVKPFSLPELFARLRALIRRSVGQSDSVITIEDVCIDTRTRTVSKGGESVPLTAREYALVELLSLRVGELVSRTQIYDHLFDENDDSLSNLVEVHVSNIRKKLGKDFIETRRGQGYIVTGAGTSSDNSESSES
ncbi:MAG: response regulator transcription factor [Planctomycetaceae bacterium]